MIRGFAIVILGLLLTASVGRGANVVSVDFLRHPIAPKTRVMLQKALLTIKAEDHHAAIRELLTILSKDPASAAWVHTLLGVEYLKTAQYKLAEESLEQAATLLPHDAINHYNLALSLVLTHDAGRGEQEARRALELDPDLPEAKRLLQALHKPPEAGN